MAELKDKFNSQKAQWDNEKVTVEHLQKLREQIEDMNNQIQKAQREYDLNEAARLQYGELPKLQKQLEAEEEKAKNFPVDGNPCGETYGRGACQDPSPGRGAS